jgi:hypothetical protein
MNDADKIADRAMFALINLIDERATLEDMQAWTSWLVFRRLQGEDETVLRSGYNVMNVFQEKLGAA